MDETILKLREICGENVYTRDDAAPLYKKIQDELLAGKKVIVDFEQKEISSESFLDEAIVEHLIHPIISDTAKKIVLRSVLRPDQALMERIYEYRKRIENKQSKKSRKTADATHSAVRDTDQDSDVTK